MKGEAAPAGFYIYLFPFQGQDLRHKVGSSGVCRLHVLKFNPFTDTLRNRRPVIHCFFFLFLLVYSSLISSITL